MQISVIIPVYNAEKFLRKAAGSALRFEDVKEVILIEDCSPDNSIGVCKQLVKEDRRVILLQHPDKKNHGAGASRNLGIKKAKYEFIAFLDADDYYLPNRFDADKEILKKNKEADGVYNAIGVHYYNAIVKEDYKKFFVNELTTVRYNNIDSKALFPGLIGYSNDIGYFHLDGLTVKKKALNKYNLWFNEKLPIHQDTDFIIRLSYYTNLTGGLLNKPVGIRGIHDNNRITENIKHKKKAHINRLRMWNEIYKWATKSNIEEKYIKHISCLIKSCFILTQAYFKAWLYFVYYVLGNRNLLFKRVYYNHIHFYLFGENKVSYFLLKFKNTTQKFIGIKSDYSNQQE